MDTMLIELTNQKATGLLHELKGCVQAYGCCDKNMKV